MNRNPPLEPAELVAEQLLARLSRRQARPPPSSCAPALSPLKEESSRPWNPSAPLASPLAAEGLKPSEDNESGINPKAGREKVFFVVCFYVYFPARFDQGPFKTGFG